MIQIHLARIHIFLIPLTQILLLNKLHILIQIVDPLIHYSHLFIHFSVNNFPSKSLLSHSFSSQIHSHLCLKFFHLFMLVFYFINCLNMFYHFFKSIMIKIILSLLMVIVQLENAIMLAPQ